MNGKKGKIRIIDIRRYKYKKETEFFSVKRGRQPD